MNVYDALSETLKITDDMLEFVKNVVILDPTNGEEAVFQTIQLLIRMNRYQDSITFLEP